MPWLPAAFRWPTQRGSATLRENKPSADSGHVTLKLRALYLGGFLGRKKAVDSAESKSE